MTEKFNKNTIHAEVMKYKQGYVQMIKVMSPNKNTMNSVL